MVSKRMENDRKSNVCLQSNTKNFIVQRLENLNFFTFFIVLRLLINKIEFMSI